LLANLNGGNKPDFSDKEVAKENGHGRITFDGEDKEL